MTARRPVARKRRASRRAHSSVRRMVVAGLTAALVAALGIALVYQVSRPPPHEPFRFPPTPSNVAPADR